ncbi:hypothetical protein [Gallaecimonas sp. GXIMD4217]|uniref:hypothetical protein n=1 Tax=Gallaecimonas sp. GXIMD4217 TaxID=3131927 RepID=UPI00311B15C8
MKKACLMATLLLAPTAQAELFVDLGLNASKVTVNIADGREEFDTDLELGPHLGLGARRAVSDNSDFGFRVELDQVGSELLLAVRALDYRYRLNDKLAFSAFLGAARYDLATPAYGYYAGLGAQWRDIMPGWDLGADFRYGEKVARDKLLPEDPQGGRPDSFYDIKGLSLYLSYRF